VSIHPFILWITAAVLLWQNRLQPADQDHLPGNGNRAALFASSLMFLLAATLVIINESAPGIAANKDFNQLVGLMEQLAVYAALPLMVINGLAKAIGYDWDRGIWGRILLAICAMFALTRTTEWLEYWLMVVLAVGVITFALPILKRKDWTFSAILLFWLALCLSYFGLDLRSSLGDPGQHWSWLGLTLLPYVICSDRWLSLTDSR
jgi:hypothetical protein